MTAAYASDTPASDFAAERRRFNQVFLFVAPAMFLGALDQTIVAAALPAMSAALDNFANIAWVVTAYLLAATVAAPVFGRLGDAFGRRRALIWALTMFTSGSIICAIAPTFEMVIAGRVLQGLGGGGLMTLAQALIGEAVSPQERGRFQGWFSAVFALASTAGPLAGGLLSQTLGWQAIFWTNVPLGLLATIIAMRVSARPSSGKFRFDTLGTGIVVAATVALLVALSIAPTTGWLAPTVVILAAIGVVGFALLIPVERRNADPLIPIDLLMQSTVWRPMVCVFLLAAVLFATIVQLPLFLQLVMGVSPTVSGMLLIPVTIAQVLVSMLAGNRVSATGHVGKIMAIGLFVSAVGFALLALSLGQGLWVVTAASIVVGLGLGTTMPVAQTMIQWAGGTARLGSATALVSFGRSIGGLVGAAVASAILLGSFELLMPSLVNQIEDALASAGSHVTLPTAALGAADMAFRWVFSALGGVTLLAALIAWTVPDVDLSHPANN